MPKHNYTQYSSTKKYDNSSKTEKTAESVDQVTTKVKMVEETVKTVPIPKTINGTVANCAKLNIREDPSIHAKIIGVVNAGSEMKINMDKSNGEWFYVITAAGIDGYCMRDFVNAKL